jgi:hypothetical protein
MVSRIACHYYGWSYWRSSYQPKEIFRTFRLNAAEDLTDSLRPVRPTDPTRPGTGEWAQLRPECAKHYWSLDPQRWCRVTRTDDFGVFLDLEKPEALPGRAIHSAGGRRGADRAV